LTPETTARADMGRIPEAVRRRRTRLLATGTETARRPPVELLTSAEVAERFGVDRRTAVVWAKRGRLRAFRTPGGQHRFRAAEIENLLNGSNGESTAD
jgi:excisionase family DNA binding protein